MRRIVAMAIVAMAAALALAGGGPASAGGGCHSNVFRDESGTQVEMSKNCFDPTVVRVQPGEQITWTSNDPEAHSVTGVAGTWGDDRNIRSGESVAYQFDESGVFPYFCFYHPSMVGAVVVGDGRGARSGAAANDGVRAVSAEAPGAVAKEQAAVVEEDSSSGVETVTIVIGVGVLAAVGGFAGALVMRRREAPEN